jgi:hypothetical protein
MSKSFEESQLSNIVLKAYEKALLHELYAMPVFRLPPREPPVKWSRRWWRKMFFPWRRKLRKVWVLFTPYIIVSRKEFEERTDHGWC